MRSLLNRLFQLVIALSMCFFLHAQSVSDSAQIHFRQYVDWEQIKRLAGEENKLIFLDCYATWCKPCKWMDQNIYTDTTVARLFNKNFISLKVQMDTSKSDNSQTKSQYHFASLMKDEFRIIGYPTYLFFSAEGQVIHKEMGQKTIPEFLQVAKNALDTQRQYYTLIKNYKNGEKNYSTMAYLAEVSLNLQETNEATTIAKDYFDNYLFKVNQDSIYTENNIHFAAAFVEQLPGSVLSFFYRQEKIIDSIIHTNGYAEGVVDYALTLKYITPYLKEIDENNHRPNWRNLERKLNHKVDKETANRNIIQAKVRWFFSKKKFEEWSKYFVFYIERYGPDWLGVNNDAWLLFQYCKDSQLLQKCLKWLEDALKTDSTNIAFIDTYANLLYKIGKIDLAIKWEEKAMALDKQNAVMQNAVPNKVFVETIEKMRRNIPTWPVND